MDNMDIFNIIVGCSSILSCIVAIFTATQVYSIKKNINVSQDINGSVIKGSEVIQSGRDTNMGR